MKRSGKIIVGLFAVALICGTCDNPDKGKAANNSKPSDKANLIGVATVTHTKWAEQNYNLPSWEWTKCDIYTYDNGWNNVMFYVSEREEPIEKNWYPTK